jgi:hypothetical protein
MTVLGTATKVYAGGVAASAVYAGSVKVWPLGPPEPPAAVMGVWTQTSGVLRFYAPNAVADGVWLVDVPQAPTPVNPGWTLGQNGPGSLPLMALGPNDGSYQTGRILDPDWSAVTNAGAAAAWSLRQLRITRGPRPEQPDLPGVLDIEVIEPPLTLPPAPPVKAGAQGVGQWTMTWPAPLIADQLLLVVTTPTGEPSGQVVVDIEPYTGTTQAAGNPYRGVVWMNEDRTVRHMLGIAASVWNGYYPAQWGGHRLRFSVDSANVLTFANLGVSPA